MKKGKLNIVLLKGGISAEREVSLKTGAAVAEALRGLGHEVKEIDVQSTQLDLPENIDFVFVALHGTFGEDGEVQKILIAKKLRFNGCGVEGCRRSWDKMESKKLFKAAGVPTPEGGVWTEDMKREFPYILKPQAQGSSVGVYRVFNENDLEETKKGIRQLSMPMMIEKMIIGRELTVGILGDEALPVIEIRPKEGFYDYANKYTAGRTEYLCPAPISEELEKKIRAVALKAHRALGCEVYSRVDVILDEKENAFVLEVNTIPGMTALSLLPKAARVRGLEFPQLCQRIIELSWELKR
ncbi:MAG: D-alanine--D-alanine ligase [Verrucomicrobiota bacterium]